MIDYLNDAEWVVIVILSTMPLPVLVELEPVMHNLARMNLVETGDQGSWQLSEMGHAMCRDQRTRLN